MKHVQKLTTFCLLLTAMLAFSGLKAQTGATGIDFFHGTFAEAQAKAKKENKLIFMDAYTTWCGPCRYMSANVFTDESVAEYYNAHFINLKMDMERGEGPTLSRRYSVMGYPTLLFINSNGEVKKRAMGGKKAAAFIALGQSVMKAN